MTLPSSRPLTATNVRQELGLPAFDLRRTDERWLADRGGDVPVQFPDDFFGKTAIKITDQRTSNAAVNHSFANVNFGPPLPGRIIRLLVMCMGKPSAFAGTGTLTLTNVMIGGVATGSTPAFAWGHGGSGSLSFVGTTTTFRQFNTGASGTISFTTPTTTSVRLIVLSQYDTDTTDNFGAFGTSETGLSGTVNVASQGLIICSAVKHNNNAISMTGVTVRGQGNVGGYRWAFGFINRLGSQSNRPVGFSSSGAARCAMIVGSLVKA